MLTYSLILDGITHSDKGTCIDFQNQKYHRFITLRFSETDNTDCGQIFKLVIPHLEIYHVYICNIDHQQHLCTGRERAIISACDMNIQQTFNLWLP